MASLDDPGMVSWKVRKSTSNALPNVLLSTHRSSLILFLENSKFLLESPKNCAILTVYDFDLRESVGGLPWTKRV